MPAPATHKHTIDRSGFELVGQPVASADVDFSDQQSIISRYYPDCVALVEAHTGARVFAFDHNIRSLAGKKSGQRVDGQKVHAPVNIVHGDYTLTSGPQRLRDLALPPTGNDTLRGILPEGESLIDAARVDELLASGTRFAIINVWRNIADTPVMSHPLALCDGQSVQPDDLVVFEIHYRDRVGENYFARHADAHRWYYYPQLTGDEALLIKQWDSASPLALSDGGSADNSDPGAPCTFSFHSSFQPPDTPADAPDRRSIEVRCIVLYD